MPDTVVYNLFLFLFRAGIRLASVWNVKAELWLKGRETIFERLKSETGNPKRDIVWMHCSSLGEFEQGRPVLEKLKAQYPGYKLLLTFFSPSGYEVRKDYKGADWVFYLPLDSAGNAKKFMDIVNPSLVIFVKYDYWYYYLAECKKRNIPLLMISAIFRKEKPFFRWYGGLYRKMLDNFTYFFVQDEESKKLLQSININNTSVAGDTRFDRVSEIAEKFHPIDEIEKFSGSSNVLIAGSTWPVDEKIIKEAVTDFPELKIIIAPHEIDKRHIEQLKSLFPDALLYSEFKAGNQQTATSRFLVIDNIGMLSRLYKYATITYIGGGFNNGIHNTLEAAVFGKPVIFGPKYEKFREAIELINAGGGFCISDASQLKEKLLLFIKEENLIEKSAEASFNYVKENKGATEKIILYIQENRLLTS